MLLFFLIYSRIVVVCTVVEVRMILLRPDKYGRIVLSCMGWVLYSMRGRMCTAFSTVGFVLLSE